MRISKKTIIIDFIIFSIFIGIITFQPFYNYGEINMKEIGVYLPGIQGIFDGMIPYKDFFHLRGPIDIYFPAFYMFLTNDSIISFYQYYYLSNVLLFISCLILALIVFRTRFITYLMLPVLIGRTFPRVIYTFWGGFRYLWGIAAISLLILFFKNTKRWFFLFLSGFISACALLTSIDVGVAILCSVFCSITFWLIVYKVGFQQYIKKLLIYSLGIVSLLLPVLIYFFFKGALAQFLDSTINVIMHLQATFNTAHFLSDTPETLKEVLFGLVNPGGPHFKYLVYIYFYLLVGAFIVYKILKNKQDVFTLELTVLYMYGIFLYCVSWRSLEGDNFVMALQMYLFIFYFLCEEGYLLIQRKKKEYKLQVLSQENFIKRKHDRWIKVYLNNFLIFSLFMYSICYSITRYERRFIGYKYFKHKLLNRDPKLLNPFLGESYERLTKGKVKGLVVPSIQAKDINEISDYIENNSTENDKVLAYHELATFNYITNRPWVHRFPMDAWTWINDSWFNSFMEELDLDKPKFIITYIDPPMWFEKSNFQPKANSEKNNQIMNFISNNYKVELMTPTYFLHALK